MTARDSADGSFPIRVERRAAAALPAAADAVVIGAGITGLLTAMRMRENGRSVVVLEARNAGSAQSGRNLGFVREQGRESVEAEAMRYAAERWRELAARHGAALGWTQAGHLSIARDEEELERVASWGSIAERVGTRFTVLRGSDLAERMPWLAPGLHGAGFTPDDGHVDPRRALPTIAGLARRSGITVVEGAAVDEIESTSGRVTGVIAEGRAIRTPLVVAAAGVWSARLLRPAGVRLPLHVGRSTVGLTKPVAPLTRASVWDVAGVGFRQSADGRVVFGLGAFVDVDVRWEDVRASIPLLPVLWKNRRTMRLHVGRPLLADVGGLATGRGLPVLERVEATPNSGTVREGLRQLRALVPALADAEPETSWAGLMDSTPDFLPIAGESGVEGLLVIAGTSGHGLGIAPALADGVAQLAETGDPPDLLAPFSRRRFERGAGAQPDANQQRDQSGLESGTHE